jgi:hypothetical protein
MVRTRLHSLIGVLVLVVACGGQGSDAVFVQALSGRGGAQPGGGLRPPVQAADIRAFRGLYRRSGDEAHFQPCGTATPLEITGSFEGRALLAERFRWNSIWQNMPLYAVLRGAIMTDSVASGDSLAPEVVRRFYVTGVDSMRAWDGDCGGMKVR